jgi:large subunit ribosomal protein L19
VDIIHEVEKKYRKSELPAFKVGDTVDVEVTIAEGGKERIQIFSGVVIAIKGKGINRTFTVRRIVQGEGVERTFPYHSPKIGNVTVKKSGSVRRAKLYYLRERTGKGARIKEMTGTRLAKKREILEEAVRAKAEAAAKEAAAQEAEAEAESAGKEATKAAGKKSKASGKKAKAAGKKAKAAGKKSKTGDKKKK